MRRPSLLRRAALAAAAIGAATPVLRRQKIPRPLVSALAWQTPVAVRLAFGPSRLRDAAVYGAQMWAYVNHYEMPNDDPERLLARVRVKYPIAIDRRIGLGELPSVRLQRRLGKPGDVRAHDTFLAWVHWSWFFFPHGTVTWILMRHPDRYQRSATLIAATFDAGCIVYWLLPTAPPWWARRDSGDGHVRRLMVEAGERFWGKVWDPLYDSLGGNPFAAMPSLHFATSLTAARVLSDTGRAAGILGWTYAATLGFALVYLGEHYVVDLIAGLALAEGVRRSEPVATPALRAFKDAIQRLELRGT